MPELLRERRRAEILSAARALVAQEGLEALTIAALEERLSFTRGVITYHFRDKREIEEALLAAALRDVDEAIEAAVRSRPDPGSAAEAVLAAVTRAFIERPAASRVLLSFWSRLHAEGRLRRRNAALYEGYRARLARRLRSAGVPAGAARPLAGALVGQVLGIVLQHVFDPAGFDAEAALREAGRTLRARLSPSA